MDNILAGNDDLRQRLTGVIDALKKQLGQPGPDQQELQLLKDRLKKVEAERDAKTADLAKKQTELDDMNQTLATLQATKTKLDEDLAAALATKKALEETDKTKAAEIESLKKQIEEKERLFKELHDDWANLESAYGTVTAQYEKLKKEHNDLVRNSSAATKEDADKLDKIRITGGWLKDPAAQTSTAAESSA
jgi:chromosome segregation ATPase